MSDHLSQQTILVVDDTEANIDVLLEALGDHYDVSVAMDGEGAIESIADEKPDLILLDIMMPGMDGYEVCRRLKSEPATADIPIIFVTAMVEVKDEAKGFELGALDYITKPISIPIVQARVNTHLTLQNAQRTLKNQNVILEEKVRERTKALWQSRLSTINCLGRAAEFRDPETGSHILRMSHYSQKLALAAGKDQAWSELLLNAAPMHDVGKVGVPDRILLKPGKLDEEEWQIMQKHVSMGAEILGNQSAPLLQLACEIAVSHHEKWDGRGYPNGLQGETIPVSGRIVAIADVFDALTSERPYKKAWEITRAMDLIQEEAGNHFDPDLAELFVAILPEILTIREKFQG
ncbi:MAG: two-component system response regulator [Magnetococcales bacterium]|nr:two-component system response regulator [Magnetococcales bacterium]